MMIAKMCAANIVPNMIAPELQKGAKYDESKSNLVQDGDHLKK